MQLQRNRVKLASNNQVTGVDRSWLLSQGIPVDVKLPRHVTWYYPNGTSGIGPSDPYHLNLYRSKGYTLRPPWEPTVPTVEVEDTPELVLSIMKLLQQHASWSGTATDLKQALGSDQTVAVFSRSITRRTVLLHLKVAGIKVERKWKNKRRELHIWRYRNNG